MLVRSQPLLHVALGESPRRHMRARRGSEALDGGLRETQTQGLAQSEILHEQIVPAFVALLDDAPPLDAPAEL